MRIFDLARLAVKAIKARWAVLPLLGMAAAAFCLCFAGAILAKVQEEKAQPYELIVSAAGSAGISESVLAGVLEIPGVKAATPILQLPVTIQADKYSARLTLTGLDADYPDGAFRQAAAFRLTA